MKSTIKNKAVEMRDAYNTLDVMKKNCGKLDEDHLIEINLDSEEKVETDAKSMIQASMDKAVKDINNKENILAKDKFFTLSKMNDYAMKPKKSKKIDLTEFCDNRDEDIRSQKKYMDKIRAGSPVVVTADGKVQTFEENLKTQEEVSKDSSDSSETKIKDSLSHLVKMVRGCFASSMSEDIEYVEFCEEAISSLIAKKTEELSPLNNKYSPNSVYVKKVGLNNKQNAFGLNNKQNVSGGAMRADEKFLDYVELDKDASLSFEDRRDLQEMIFTHAEGSKKIDTDHFFRYFAEIMKKYGSKAFDDLDLSNVNIDRLKAILQKEKEEAVVDAQDVVDKAKAKAEKHRQAELEVIEKHSIKKKTKKKMKKKVTRNKTTKKKNTKKKVAKKKIVKKKVLKKRAKRNVK